MDQNTQKVSYSKYAFNSPSKDAPLEDLYGYIEGFAKRVNIREVKTRSGPTKVADVDISVILPDKRTERYFGKEFVNEYHNVRFRVTYWGYQAENIAGLPPQVNQKVLALVKDMKVDVRTGNDGKTYHSILCTGCDNLHTNSARKEGGELTWKGSDQTPENADDNSDPEAVFAEVGIELLDGEGMDDSDMPF